MTDDTHKIEDYISGKMVNDTPEEIEAVQVFSKRLVEDFGYKKNQIQTHPQFRAKTAPSGKEKYPIDITIFKSDKKTYDNVYIIVECKQPSRKDGLVQLNIYLNLVPSVEFGIWFNGKEHLYLRKVSDPKHGLTWQEIPDIPKRGQRVEDIGLYKRKDLLIPANLVSEFNDLRNHLAGNVTGITRDEAFAQEIINILFCKIHDEMERAPEEQVKFRTGIDESKNIVKERIEELFKEVKETYDDVFEENDSIKLDDDAIVYIVGALQKFVIKDAERDAIGDAFEVFIGPALRGSDGQFFTPRNVVKMAVDMIDPQIDDYVIDPSCGSGGFLIIALEHMWDKIEKNGKKKKWDRDTITRKKKDLATKFIQGIDKDSFLAKVTKAYMAIIGDGRGGIFSENSLYRKSEWKDNTNSKIELGKYNVLFTNPPFGIKIPIRGENVLSQFHLAKKWRYDKKKNTWIEGSIYENKRPPQVLFIERCLELLREGGRMAIVLPDSIVGNKTDGYIRKFILSKAKLLAVVDCPIETFANHTKTSVLVLEKKSDGYTKKYPIFMAIAKKCGHDRRGKEIHKINSKGKKIPDDDFPLISEKYKEFRRGSR